MNNKKVNWWKWICISLITVILVIIAIGVILIFLTKPDGHNSIIPPVEQGKDGAQFTIITTKEDINRWLAMELMEEQGQERGSYRMFLDDFVYFQTEVKAFGMIAPVEMVLEPTITENGNMELKEHSFSIGNLSLPSSTVFQLIDSTVELPNWIYINPSEQKLYLNLRTGVSEDVQIKINQFDLERNKIEISLIMH